MRIFQFPSFVPYLVLTLNSIWAFRLPSARPSGHLGRSGTLRLGCDQQCIAARPGVFGGTVPRSSALWLAFPQDDDSEDCDISDSNQSEQPQQLQAEEEMGRKNRPMWTVPKPLQKLGWGIYLLWSFCIWFLGSAFTVGLFLNLFGYGYTFSKDEGLRIDTIQQFRIERQFEMESQRYEKEVRNRLPSVSDTIQAQPSSHL